MNEICETIGFLKGRIDSLPDGLLEPRGRKYLDEAPVGPTNVTPLNHTNAGLKLHVSV